MCASSEGSDAIVQACLSLYCSHTSHEQACIENVNSEFFARALFLHPRSFSKIRPKRNGNRAAV